MPGATQRITNSRERSVSLAKPGVWLNKKNGTPEECRGC
jgi:hypothetical protein